MPAYSLDPAANARVFLCSEAESLRAAAAYVPGGDPAEAGVWNLIAETAGSSAREALLRCSAAEGLRCTVHGARVWLSGPRGALGRCLGALEAAGEPLAAELFRAAAAFEAARSIGRTEVMGVLNLTPDSFSDGGRWVEPEEAVQEGLRMVSDGATILDLGGESTRPGAVTIPEEEELRRVLPVLRRLRAQTTARISVDTRKARVAAECLEAGADWINDVSGLCYAPELAARVARHPEARLVLMHFRRRPEDDRFSTEYDADGRPVYDDVVADSLRWLRERIRVALDAGIPPERLWIDPGFGFGKTPAQNVELLRRLREYTSVGLPVLVGTSRKSTVGRLVGNLPPDQRLEGTAATVVWAIANGASAIRVHDVPQMSRLARAADALRSGMLD